MNEIETEKNKKDQWKKRVGSSKRKLITFSQIHQKKKKKDEPHK